MPEGHTIHRLARRQGADLQGEVLRVDAPQSRAGSAVKLAGVAGVAAASLDGARLVRVDAYGKHLLHRFEDGQTLHVHLGLFGRFVRKRDPGLPPRETCRLRLATDVVAWDLSGAVASGLLDAGAEAALLSRLGPDPLRPDADPDRAWAKLGRRRSSIASALMDQSVLAGVGNVYRAEALFAAGVDPDLPARELPREVFDELWVVLRDMLRDGERAGKIVTVPAEETDGVPRAKLRGRDRVQVYRRDTCRRCGEGVRSRLLEGRTLWWCPACQPPGAAG